MVYERQPTRAFERVPGRRAGGLDAFTYSLATRGLINIDLKQFRQKLEPVFIKNCVKTNRYSVYGVPFSPVML